MQRKSTKIPVTILFQALSSHSKFSAGPISRSLFLAWYLMFSTWTQLSKMRMMVRKEEKVKRQPTESSIETLARRSSEGHVTLLLSLYTKVQCSWPSGPLSSRSSAVVEVLVMKCVNNQVVPSISGYSWRQSFSMPTWHRWSSLLLINKSAIPFLRGQIKILISKSRRKISLLMKG